MVDALASGASTGNGVEVRVLFWAPINPKYLCFINKIKYFYLDMYTLLYTFWCAPNLIGHEGILAR